MESQKRRMISASHKRTWYIVQVDLRSKLIGYIHNNWIGPMDDMKSTRSYAFILGFDLLAWASHKQDSMSQSSAERVT